MKVMKEMGYTMYQSWYKYVLEVFYKKREARGSSVAVHTTYHIEEMRNRTRRGR